MAYLSLYTLIRFSLHLFRERMVLKVLLKSSQIILQNATNPCLVAKFSSQFTLFLFCFTLNQQMNSLITCFCLSRFLKYLVKLGITPTMAEGRYSSYELTISIISIDIYHGAAILNISHLYQCYQIEAGRTK